MANQEDNNLIFIDTNVLVFANVISSPFHEKARAKLIYYANRGWEMIISYQVIREYISVLSRHDARGKNLPNDVIINDIERFTSEFTLVYESYKTLENLKMLMLNCDLGGKQIHDANIVATMINHGIKTLLTHNIDDFVRFNNYISIQEI